LFASIPPTLAALFIIKSGCTLFIKKFVSSNENRFASFRVAGITSKFPDLVNILLTDEPTRPELPNIRTFFITSPFNIYYLYLQYNKTSIQLI